MSDVILHEDFAGHSIDSRLSWFNLPRRWELRDSRLVVEPHAKSDFWYKTHYGFIAHNGSLLYADVSGDFILTTRVRLKPQHQYDQAGLMVRLSPRSWLKTSVEYELEGPNKLGVVVTNGAYSDWSTQDLDRSEREITFRVRRESGDYIVEYALAKSRTRKQDGPDWTQLRMTHLSRDKGMIPTQCGLYACSPKGEGFRAEFEYLKIERGRKE
ncbi:MAG: DUF1349 domain-containing protein [Candidatus Hydrogenedentes bacterium]|nr:DUF1349 domain-containing protein [Candidatus Hydrogenedentota bacterium]